MPASKLIIAGDKRKTVALQRGLNGVDASIRHHTPASLGASIAKEAPDGVILLCEADPKPVRALIEKIKRHDDNLPIIVLGEAKKVAEVVDWMKTGIFDYLSFPPDWPRLQTTLKNAFRLYNLTKRIFLLENRLGIETQLDEMVAAAEPMQAVFQAIKNVAKANATVLIVGESGTGKELVAKAIHRLSPRNNRRFIDINCGAIPRELLENELFGHERGAYTGADKRYIGCCERANGGTLFLDEISEMDIALQVKLLRFLQERRFNRVGGTEAIPVDVRIVAATNRNLADAVLKGRFREDLFYRLNVVPIPLPPLRERREDIPLLARTFLERYVRKNEKIFLDFTPEAMELLMGYNWPGNIRELENTIERAVVLHNDTKIKPAHLPQHLRSSMPGGARLKVAITPLMPPLKPPKSRVLPLTQVERYAIEAAMKVCTGNVALAARRLKIGQATLYRKLKQYGIRP